MSEQSFHAGVDIDWMLKQRDELLAISFKIQGHALSAETAREYLNELKAEGKKAVPGCDNVDSEGYCLGHSTPPTTEQQEN